MSDKPNLLTKRQIVSIKARVEKHSARIAKERDALRELLEDLDAKLESIEDAGDHLQSAIDRLSEYL